MSYFLKKKIEQIFTPFKKFIRIACKKTKIYILNKPSLKDTIILSKAEK